MPIMRQAIVWANGGLITNTYMRHSASMSYWIDAENREISAQDIT